MSRIKDNNKKKIKRKKGKKFVYRNPSEEVAKKSNPFEEMSKKKLMKQSSKYDGVRNEFQTKNLSNTFIDKRLGENSKNLTHEEKMKLRFKAQQMLNMKNKKNKFSLNNLNDEENHLTHMGKKIGENEYDLEDDFIQSDDEMYDKLDNYMNQIENAPDTKLSRKEIIQNIIEKSKQFKLEKQNLKRKNIEQIKLLDDNFAELSELITRRPRTLGRLNDDFERMANSYNYLDKTKPTERIKSEKEIEMEKENEIKKKLRQQIREESDGSSDEDNNNIDGNSKNNPDNSHSEVSDDSNKLSDNEQEKDNVKRTLTKKERIIKLMEKRLNRAGKKVEKDDIILLKKKRNRVPKIEEEGINEDLEEQTDDINQEVSEDDLSDLKEFDGKKNIKRKNNHKAMENSADDEIEEEEKDYDDFNEESYEENEESYEENEENSEENNSDGDDY